MNLDASKYYRVLTAGDRHRLNAPFVAIDQGTVAGDRVEQCRHKETSPVNRGTRLGAHASAEVPNYRGEAGLEIPVGFPLTAQHFGPVEESDVGLPSGTEVQHG